jgi:hypothetical protein
MLSLMGRIQSDKLLHFTSGCFVRLATVTPFRLLLLMYWVDAMGVIEQVLYQYYYCNARAAYIISF